MIKMRRWRNLEILLTEVCCFVILVARALAFFFCISFLAPFTFFFIWQCHDKPIFFTFNAFPFGLSTAPYIFTKILKPAVHHWRSSGIKVCMFLDDGLGGKSSCQSTKVDAIAVKIDLCALGFVLSSSNCNWHPSLIQTWLGYVLNIFENKLYVT